MKLIEQVGKRARGEAQSEPTTESEDVHPSSAGLGRHLHRLGGWWIELAAGLVALGMGCYQLSLPNVLTGATPPWIGYDDGVYIGVAIRLIHGVLPYRDFVYVHPPGIALLMAPAALWGAITGSTANALILARIVTVVVTAANAVLVGRLVRPIGRVAVAVSAFSLALWPLTVGVDRTLELEPYLVLFCLLGAITIFGSGEHRSSRRMFVGGLLFGFAFVVKVWAIMPIAAVVLVFVPKWRREGKWLVLGMAVAFVVTCAVFFIAAPQAFVHDVFVDQLYRQNSTAATPFDQRLLLITGLSGLTATSVSSVVATILFVALLVVVLVVYGLWWRQRTRLEWYILAAAVITFIGMFDAPYLEPHYVYFPAAMLAPLLGVCSGRLWSAAHRGSLDPARRRQALVVGVSVVALVGATVFFVQQDTTYAGSYLAGATDVSALDSYIPPGACVVSDYTGTLVLANRFTPSTSGCPAIIDSYGMYLSEDDGGVPHLGGSFPAAFKLDWFSILQQAQYVELRIPYSDFIPWTVPLELWFQQNYRQIAEIPDDYGYPIYLYERK